MAIDTRIQYEDPENLYLDPKNPRLGRHNTEANLSQEKILGIMKDWTLDELAISFIENGFWPQEALMVVEEPIGKKKIKVVVEGNRRLAALKLLFMAKQGKALSKKWQEIAETCSDAKLKALTEIPYLVATTRKEVQAYIGFRHVTGIKQWDPAEKAEYIAHLIDDEKMSYREVTRKIGSRIDTVRQNYISYRLLLQMEDSTEGISVEHVEDKFSVLSLSMRTSGVQKYLNIDVAADVKHAKSPVPKDKVENLAKFATWLFGNDEKEPIITDSRKIEGFGKLLESKKSIEYMERTKNPKFEVAYRLAAGDEAETREMVEQAADLIEQALGTAHHHTGSKHMQEAVERLGRDALMLLNAFPDIKAKLGLGN